MPIQTPCVGVCRMHKIYKVCEGCYRSPLEIRQWAIITDEQKELIIKRLENKRKIYGDLNAK